MPDDSLDILVRTTSDTTGAKQSVRALDDVAAASKRVGETGQEAAKQAGKGIEELGLKHQELRAALRGLGQTYPEVARFAELGIHPIGIAVAAAAGAFELFEKRVQAATHVLAGFELPDLSEDRIGHVNAMAAAFAGLADNLRKAADAAHSVNVESARVSKAIEAQTAQAKQLLDAGKESELADLEQRKGSMSPSEYIQRKLAIEDRYAIAGVAADHEGQKRALAEKGRRGANLEIDAAAKLREAGAIHIASPEDDAATENKLKAEADMARKDMQERRERLGDLAEGAAPLEFGKSGFFSRVWDRARHVPMRYWNYGLASGSTARGIEEHGIFSDQDIINRYHGFLGRKAQRDAEQARRRELIEGAGKEGAEAIGINQGLAGDMAAFRQQASVDWRVAGTHSLARAQGEAGKAQEDLKRVGEEISKALEGHKTLSTAIIQKLADTQRQVSTLTIKVQNLQGSQKAYPPGI